MIFKRSISKRAQVIGRAMAEGLSDGLATGPNPDPAALERAIRHAASVSRWWNMCLLCPKSLGHDGPHGPDVPDPLIRVAT